MKTILVALIIILIVIVLVLMNKETFKEFKYPQQYYFDNNATTFIYDDSVINEIVNNLNTGNPSNSLHYLGSEAKETLNKSREIVANDLKVNPSEIFFTGCATESNNIIISDIVNNWMLHNKGQATVITSNIEHGSINHILDNLKLNNRLNVIKIKVVTDRNSKWYGSINPKDVLEAINNNENVILLSFMYVNNETGAILPIKEIGQLAKAYNIFFHTDATQAIPKMIIHPYELNINAMSFSGHKFHAPKGVGCLFIQAKCDMFDKPTQEICAQFKTNSQEHFIRGGTENIAFISALARALELVHKDRDIKNIRMKAKKQYIIEQLVYHGCEIINPHKSVDNTILVILKGISCCNKSFVRELSEKYGVCVGTSSACLTSGEHSHVLDAMKVKDCYAEKVIRISMSDYNTEEEVRYLVKSIVELLNKERKTPEYNNNIDSMMN